MKIEDYEAKEFYPTPEKLLEDITADIKWYQVKTILEPSAGKGNIAEFIRNCYKKYDRSADIDCIEIDPDLRSVLKGKRLRVVHDDFLTYHTFKKYDLIVMNPPFNSGEKHLLKALEMQKDGGGIICILNADTLRNSYTNERKDLVKQLENLNAEITYHENEFVSAEHPTNVTIAVIKVLIPKTKKESGIFESMKKKNFQETGNYQDITDLAPNDFIQAIVRMYETEAESGIRLIEEYNAMKPYIMNDLRDDSKYKHPIIEMKIDNADPFVNEYIRNVRMKYWTALFSNQKFTGQMTSNLSKEYLAKVQELADYDFSLYNIKCLQLEMSQNLIQGIEECIINLFDELSHQYAYSNELQNNIHYYNGWCTNKAWYINKKVIIPIDAFSKYYGNGKFDPDFHVKQKLSDIEKALNYLDGGLTDGVDLSMTLDQAKKAGQTQKIHLKYFTVTFYKKGTCHLEFNNLDLLKKLNIFGSQHKRWLPPAYGKKKYQEMSLEEKAVIDEFEGETQYGKTFANADYYIYAPNRSMMIEMEEDEERKTA